MMSHWFPNEQTVKSCHIDAKCETSKYTYDKELNLPTCKKQIFICQATNLQCILPMVLSTLFQFRAHYTEGVPQIWNFLFS